MTDLKKYIPLFCLGIIFAAAVFSFSLIRLKVKATRSHLLSPLPEEYNVLGAAAKTDNDNTLVQTALKRKINILVLGLDGRLGDDKPRCDAIHMLTIDNKNRNILITSLPRGTLMEIPGQDADSSYVANACHILGIEKTITEIEKILNIKSDYTVKVGFSQVMGILRTANLPAVSTLQFLRNRSVAFGDNQRSHNQGLFIKDMFVNHLHDFEKIPRPLAYLLYKTVETDLSFELLYRILDNLKESDWAQHPEKISVITKTAGNLPVTDNHLDEEINAPDTQINSDTDFQIYQKNLEDKISKIISDANSLSAKNKPEECFGIIKTPFDQKIWLQVEDHDRRYQLEYEMLLVYTGCSPDKTLLSSLILDYNNEMEIENQPDYQKRGEELLNQFNDRINTNPTNKPINDQMM